MGKASWFVVLLVVCTLGACGGGNKKKSPGDPCEGNTDCADQLCHLGICVSPNPVDVGQACERDDECFSWNCDNGVCVPGTQSLGAECKENIECASRLCAGGVCVSSEADGAVDAGVDSTPPDSGVDMSPAADMAADASPAADSGVDMSPAADVGQGPDACVTGYGCDDGDDTTYDDKCSAGACQGKPYTCAVPSVCHEYTYDGSGTCDPGNIHIKLDSCAVADTAIPPSYTCYAKGPVPNTCQACDPSVSQTALVAYPGKGCVTTVAGTGAPGWTDGPASQATFTDPIALALDETKSFLYVVDGINGAKIRYVDLTTDTVHTLVGPVGSTVKPVAACQDTATGKAPYFKQPSAAALDAQGNLLVADHGCYAVRKVFTGTQASPTKDSVQTVAGQLGQSASVDGAATSTAQFKGLHGLAVDLTSDKVYIATYAKLRVLDTKSNMVSTVLDACSNPFCEGVTVASANTLYVSGGYGYNYKAFIDEVNVATKSIYLYAGSAPDGHADGSRLTAKFHGIEDLVFHNGTIYAIESKNMRLRTVDTSSELVDTLAGSGSPGSADGDALQATFGAPMAIAVHSKTGEVYIADQSQHRIRKYSPK